MAAVSSVQLSAMTIKRSDLASCGIMERSVPAIMDASLCAGITTAIRERVATGDAAPARFMTASRTSANSTVTGSSNSKAAAPNTNSSRVTKGSRYSRHMLLVFDDSRLDALQAVQFEFDLTKHLWEFTQNEGYGSPPILASGTLPQEEKAQHLHRINY